LRTEEERNGGRNGFRERERERERERKRRESARDDRGKTAGGFSRVLNDNIGGRSAIALQRENRERTHAGESAFIRIRSRVRE